MGNPINEELHEKYANLVDELNAKITIRRADYAHFEEIFEYLYDQIKEAHPELVKKRRLINTFLHFMYWDCDLGENPC